MCHSIYPSLALHPFSTHTAHLQINAIKPDRHMQDCKLFSTNHCFAWSVQAIFCILCTAALIAAHAEFIAFIVMVTACAIMHQTAASYMSHVAGMHQGISPAGRDVIARPIYSKFGYWCLLHTSWQSSHSMHVMPSCLPMSSSHDENHSNIIMISSSYNNIIWFWCFTKN